jgi:hypothetical protein
MKVIEWDRECGGRRRRRGRGKEWIGLVFTQ